MSALYLNLLCASVSKMYPKVPESPQEVFLCVCVGGGGLGMLKFFPYQLSVLRHPDLGKVS